MSTAFTILLAVCAVVGLPLWPASSAAKKGHSFWTFYAAGFVGVLVCAAAALGAFDQAAVGALGVLPAAAGAYFVRDQGVDAVPAWFHSYFPPVLGVVGWTLTFMLTWIIGSTAVWLTFAVLLIARLIAFWTGRSESALFAAL